MTRRLSLGGRQGRGDPPLAHQDDSGGPGLLASRAFWIGGAVSVVIWIVLGLIFWGAR